MKVFIFLTLISTMASAQIEESNGQVLWRVVKQYEKSSEALLKELKALGKFSALELFDDEIIGKFTEAIINYQGSASMYLMASNLMGSFRIQFKQSQFKITVKNIKFESLTRVDVFDQGSIEPIEKCAFNGKGEFRKRFRSKDTPILEDSLSKLFQLSQNDDW